MKEAMTETIKEAMKDIHDIRPPVMVGLDPEMVRMGLGIGAILLLVLAAILIIRHFWKKRQPASPIDAVAHILPYDAAVKALDRLALNPVHDAKAFYFDLSHTLKAYMGGTYRVNSLEMTTPELIKTLRSLDIPGDLKSGISQFQDLCDPFRYAPLAPDQAQVKNDLTRARDLISAMEREIKDRIADDEKEGAD